MLSEQGKALDKLNHANEYPLKLKNLMDELRYVNNKLRETEERMVKEEATAKKQFEHMMKLEQLVKELRGG